MQSPGVFVVSALIVVSVASASAQTLPASGDTNSAASDLRTAQGQTFLVPEKLPLGPEADRGPLKTYGHDMKRFFSMDTARFMSIAGLFAVAALPLDDDGIERTQSQWRNTSSFFRPGNIGGSFFVQAGAGAATLAIGKAIGSTKTAAVGGDLLRAQLVSQTVVQGIKIATQRTRPDGSNNHSFPSGHTASAFAMAGVLQSHLGWKIGAPAYGFAAYVGAARMQANRHHLSDVMMGAALGIAASRAVTLDLRGAKFDMGVAPTQGGAAVTFTRR